MYVNPFAYISPQGLLLRVGSFVGSFVYDGAQKICAALQQTVAIKVSVQTHTSR